jgi:hypothetical protein
MKKNSKLKAIGGNVGMNEIKSLIIKKEWKSIMKNKNEWTRVCPKCGELLYYVRRWAMVAANKKKSECKSCSVKGRLFSEEQKEKISKSKLGKKRGPHSDEHKKKLSDKLKGRVFSEEHRKKISDKLKGRVFSEEHRKNIGRASKGRMHSNESKLKMRISTLLDIETKYGNVFPNYNPNSIPIIEKRAKELGITDLQHAENGGEYYIKELGYFVDGYSKEKNIVIEYDEKYHKRQTDKDKIRQMEITNYLNCEFIRITENE